MAAEIKGRIVLMHIKKALCRVSSAKGVVNAVPPLFTGKLGASGVGNETLRRQGDFWCCGKILGSGLRLFPGLWHLLTGMRREALVGRIQGFCFWGSDSKATFGIPFF